MSYQRSGRGGGSRRGVGSRFGRGRGLGRGGVRGRGRGRGQGGGRNRGRFRSVAPGGGYGAVYSGGDSYDQFGMSLPKINWSAFKLEPFQKKFYAPNVTVMARNDQQILDYRRQYEITVFGNSSGGAINRPVETFIEANFPQYILKELANAGFVKPTAIQSQG